MTDLDPHLQAANRLKLASILSAASEVEFSSLRDALDVSDSVLSKLVSTLTELDYVRSRKGVHHGRRTTWVALTRTGDRALKAHVAALREIIATVQA
jgi:DNA-binding MarR family transcriptional regulator